MAVQDGENPSLPGARLSPGDAAFERLRQRESQRARENPGEAPGDVSATPETGAVGPPLMPPDWAPPPAYAGSTGAGAAAGPKPEAIVSPSLPAESSPVTPAASAPVTEKSPDRVLAVAAALGIEVELSAPVSAVAAEPSNFLIEPTTPSADATAARLEAALLDQLKSLEETLIEDAPPGPPHLPRAEPLRLREDAAAAPGVAGPPKRSVFAPDPVRQRTYVDLRSPAPPTERAASDDPPWRKYLAEAPPRRTGDRGPSVRSASPGRSAAWPLPVAVEKHGRRAETEERGSGIRAMTVAAVLGLGVGLGLLVLIRPFADTGVSTVAGPAAGVEAPVAAAAPPTSEAGAAAPSRVGAGGPLNQALATLLADPPESDAALGRPAVITEPGVPAVAEPSEAFAPAPAPASAEVPVVIRPPSGQAQRAARVPDFDAARPGPLAYGPVAPSHDPVRRSLLDDEAAPPAKSPDPAAAARGTAQEAAAAVVSPGRATINGFVNLRAKPDNAAPVVAVLADGLSVRVIGCDYWCEVEAGGKRGFVFKKFVTR